MKYRYYERIIKCIESITTFEMYTKCSSSITNLINNFVLVFPDESAMYLALMKFELDHVLKLD